MEYLADCRARLAFDLLANTWNPVVLWALRDGPRRHADLRRHIGGIRQKVLTETLRRLEEHGLVARRSRPGRVDYALTGLGASLLGPIGALGEWGHDHGDAVMAALDRESSTAGSTDG
ncbi:winged helix-turn-helix transcriptional regulator [Saccharothrix coeruleofusca]|uniref:HxlR family transcriptional regulator n=1 Tax=Saccharothrix coeruleofusca TaxID=33919 RepID=A0A918ANY0_9PSEU|nr:helix-turn-helix domain-containing protein [Saccharothrix coeruleofusca]GGP65059.1 HxlR family transcriptional regulator [Saccharothrix coeruleofusca]